jgi:hypothetical protein
MTRKQVFISLPILLVAFAGWYAYSQYTRKNKDLVQVKADVQMTSTELISSFESNEKMANDKFLDKIISVRGTIKGIDKDDKGYYTVILGEENSMSSVRCSMDSAHQKQMVALKPNSNITIKGACTGFNSDELLGSDVILNRAVVVESNQ